MFVTSWIAFGVILGSISTTLSKPDIEPIFTECGRTTPRLQPMVVGGTTAGRGELPWHAAVYKRTSSPYKLICGGSIVSRNVVLSAAHCFWDLYFNVKFPASNFAVAAGKIYRSWRKKEPSAQFSFVEELVIPDSFRGEDRNFADDIALVILTQPFEFKPYLRPVCLEFDNALEETQLTDGNLGKMAGWGLISGAGDLYSLLKTVELPYMGFNSCLWKTPSSYWEVLSNDKFCAGYTNGDTALCKGDSGGGLVFPSTDPRGVTRYYLRGIVSSSPSNDTKCNTYAVTTFTKVSRYGSFIRQRVPGTTSTTTEGLRVATLKPSTTTEYELEFPVYSDETDSCPELSPDVTAPKTGSKAWDKCIEYQDSFVYPCRRMTLMGSQSRANLCHHVTDSLILGGEDAKENEFPHMVLLGYKPPGVNSDLRISDILWLCAGTILSSSYVLTSGHCNSHRQFKTARLVRTGFLDRSSPIKKHQVYLVAEVIMHPDFKLPSRYHDIALLKTRNPMKLDSYVTPACLDLGRGVDNNKALVTGWGPTSDGGKEADRLQKVILAKFPPDECQNWYGRERKMAQGYLDDRQICYGDQQQLDDWRNSSIPPADRIARVYGDSCQGGGPAQVKNSVLKCMYTVVGVNSLGKGCGNGPGVYTRVSYYVPWIQSVVWGSRSR